MKFLRVVSLLFICCGVAAAQVPDGNALAVQPASQPLSQPDASTHIIATGNPLPQDLPSQALTKGTWELGLLDGGGAGLSYARNIHFAYAGARVGWILTNDHFSGWGRGNLEWAVDLLPVYTVITPTAAVYGGSFKPAIWKWNFTSGKRIAPYVLVAGGILFSTRNLPSANTSWVNFSPQAAFGAHIFTKAHQALFFEGSYVHHSNAGLSAFNPGYNASIFFTIGYDWFKSGR